MIDLHDHEGIERLRRELRIDPHHIKRLRVEFYKNSRSVADSLEALPAEVRDTVRDRVRFHHLELADRHDSQIDGASKLVFRTADELLIESVILRVDTGRTALCISSQVGCAADCAFCATGKLGLSRNLSSGEILDQVVQANLLLSDEGRRIRNIVFMGMGEPFHNESAVHDALRTLEHGECFHHPLSRVSVSTVGIPDAMVRCADAFPRVRIALSLHSTRAEVRQRLIPLANRYPLDALRSAITRIGQSQRHPVMLEYLLLEGLTDSDEDLQSLVDFADGLTVHVNLIPYNPIQGAEELRATPQPRREAFANELKARGFKVTLRYSLGADVTAACGQLVRNSQNE